MELYPITLFMRVTGVLDLLSEWGWNGSVLVKLAR